MTSPQHLPAFDTPALARAIEALPESQIDTLPFGAIRLDDQGCVVYYSATESRLSGFGDRDRLGLPFFTKIAPCMNNAHFLGRIEKAKALGRLDIEFTHFGDFDDGDREITVRVQSAAAGGYWIFMRREA